MNADHDDHDNDGSRDILTLPSTRLTPPVIKSIQITSHLHHIPFDFGLLTGSNGIDPASLLLQLRVSAIPSIR
jgi:hypothetical protein